MYLIIDEQYRLYKSKTLTGKIRALAKSGRISVVNLKSMQGLNAISHTNHSICEDPEDLLPEWSDIQDLPKGFEID